MTNSYCIVFHWITLEVTISAHNRARVAPFPRYSINVLTRQNFQDR